MKHFLEINQLSYEDIMSLMKRALQLKTMQVFPSYACRMANLFYENSTRTRVSFEIAAEHLGMRVVNFDLERSSEQKGEVIEDTIHTLSAMGVSIFAIRHRQNGLPQAIAGAFPKHVHVINAGDGTHAHPTQALLDMVTIYEQKSNLSQLKIAIVGDLLHSRVANSLQNICALLGVAELRLVAPQVFQPKVVQFGHVTNSLQEGLSDADVVIGLRIQRERLSQEAHMDIEAYRRDYALTTHSLSWAKPDVMVMHPGPMNRGVEIDSDLADGPRSFIFEQVKNGVFARMAVLERLIQDK